MIHRPAGEYARLRANGYPLVIKQHFHANRPLDGIIMKKYVSAKENCHFDLCEILRCRRRTGLAALAVFATLGLSGAAAAQARHYKLESADGLQLHNVTAEPAKLEGKKGLRVTFRQGMEKESGRQLALITDQDFSNGTIEAEIAGSPAPGEDENARGFVGIAFRVQKDARSYDAFYLRPTNGRSEDQERRNHSTQYISQPDWPWFRLRKETPSKYESYVDVVPGSWTKIRIEVNGAQARLYVHDQKQPTLIVNDLKTGAQGKGAIALWIEFDTIAHFRNLTVVPR